MSCNIKLMKSRTIGFKTEVSQSTAVALVSKDFLNAMEFACTPVIEQIEDNFVSTGLGNRATIPSKKSYTLTTNWKLRGSGSVAGQVVAPFNAQLLSAGFSGSGTTTASYVPVSTARTNHCSPATTCTVLGNYGGQLHSIKGVAGNMKFTFTAGEPVQVDYNGMGLWQSVTDVALPTVTYPTTQPPQVESITFNIDGYPFLCSKFEFDMGNQLTMVEDVNSADGIAACIITDRAPVGSLQAANTNIADHDFFGRMENGTIGSGSCTVGTSAGNTFEFLFNAIQYSNVQYTNNNGRIDVNATLRFIDGTNDWLTIKCR